MSNILIAEDDPFLRELVADLFREHGEEVVEAADGDEALQKLEAHIFDLIICELRIPGKSGIDVLHAAKRIDELTPVIILSSHADVAAALEALQLGAYDYLLKREPFSLAELRMRAERALTCSHLVRAIDHLKDTQPYICDCEHVVGYSARLQKTLASLRKEVSTTSTILITGEPGTGKTLLAAAIHATSPRRTHTFVEVNCAALPEQRLTSELFGYAQSALPGADRQRIGCFERAQLGTLFLHGIGGMALNTQTKVLRVLQERKLERGGSSRSVMVDVRVIAAANRGLKQAMREGRFRADLYARLNVISVEMPPLRERPEDILPLAHFFLQKYNRLFGRGVKRFDAPVQKAFLTYPWPGNIRELANTVERGVLLAMGEVIGLSSLGMDNRHFAAGEEDTVVKLPSRGVSLKEVERQALLQALQTAKWVQKDAAAILDISPRVMNYKLKTHSITHAKWLKRR
ncbi:MAG: sigma-54-dependent Fis family transcriptional regulator [Nitrospinae bacterium]|nr:sigma-54-dependent Fis family transcriptional regulator [Nitrospinota bacterium]